ncbi:unnamed protein product [Angiostrongylus costaricensis]|uniref:Piwi domain-containing protein n=1 Tax=Angiostrongylus costaricensis TaxID=334426 RepID=A0A0R3Q1F6_ANGCS|nr:unnamed protein product [Angiostrongylus costaricensis]
MKLTDDSIESKPTYTYITIQKRHLTRFYQPTDEFPIVCKLPPLLFQPYLGTTRPSHYTVVFDEWGLSADKIYEMCYRLCFLYARCRIPVSLPCPVYYAHRVCEKAKEVYKSLLKLVLLCYMSFS